MSDYTCGTCGTSGLVAEAVPMCWQIKCANGHLVFPTPGTVLAWRTNALDELTAEWAVEEPTPESASPLAGGRVIARSAFPTIHVHRCRSDRDHPAHHYDVDGDVYLCQGIPGQEVIISPPPVPVEADPDWLENGP